MNLKGMPTSLGALCEGVDRQEACANISSVLFVHISSPQPYSNLE